MNTYMILKKYFLLITLVFQNTGLCYASAATLAPNNTVEFNLGPLELLDVAHTAEDLLIVFSTDFINKPLDVTTLLRLNSFITSALLLYNNNKIIKQSNPDKSNAIDVAIQNTLKKPTFMDTVSTFAATCEQVCFFGELITAIDNQAFGYRYNHSMYSANLIFHLIKKVLRTFTRISLKSDSNNYFSPESAQHRRSILMLSLLIDLILISYHEYDLANNIHTASGYNDLEKIIYDTRVEIVSLKTRVRFKLQWQRENEMLRRQREAMRRDEILRRLQADKEKQHEEKNERTEAELNEAPDIRKQVIDLRKKLKSNNNDLSKLTADERAFYEKHIVQRNQPCDPDDRIKK